jgi:long-chain acyl-CoA synthetase
MKDSFCQRLINSCEKHSERTAMRIVGDEQEIYNYSGLLKQIRSVAYRIKEEKIGFGDRVALIGENHPCWAVSYLATLYHGAVCVPIDPHGEIETITNFLENSETKLAFLSPEVTGKFARIEEKLGRHIPSVVWRMENSSNGFEHFEDWVKTDFPESYAREMPKAKGDDTALLIYTSGTTGTPKGVPLSHGNITAELDGIYEVLKLTEKEKILSLLPLFHAYLQIVNLWVATTYGAEVGYLKEMTPDELGKAMREFKPTMLTTVPRLWYLFHKKIFDAVEAKPKPVQVLFKGLLAANGFFRNTLKINLGKTFFGKVQESFGGNLRFAVTAGSRFDEAVADDFFKLGFTIIQGYGLTETSGAATATYEDDNRVGSVGKPFFNAEVKINNPDKEGIGEVLIRGAMVFRGYYKNPTATADVFTEDGWFRSGDLGKFDADGHLYIVGRAKDVIVLPTGKNVHPEDLEVHYLKTPLVEELAILGIEDKSVGKAGAEKLVAVVVPDFEYLKQAKIANSQTAIRFELDNLGRELPEYQRVREYIVRAEPLPRTATRKIKRFELQKEIKAGKISSGEKPPEKIWAFSAENDALLESNVGRAVVEVIKRNAKETEKIHPQMNLEIDLGLDSLARAEVFAALENAFSTEFEGEEAAQALTVGDVVEMAQKNSTEIDENQAISTNLNWAKIVKNADDDLPELRSVLKNRPFFSPFAFSVYKTFNLFCKGFMRLEVENIENLRGLDRPFLICPNHQSFLDPFVLCSTYPFDKFKNTFHVGASEFFENRLMAWVAQMLQVVPVDPDTQLMKAMKAGAIGLKHGKVLNIYPEGERGFDGELHEFKKGAAILATELDLPILPVALDGLQNVWARRSWRIRPAKVRIRFGKPFYAKEIVDESMNDEQKYELVIDHLKESIKTMIDELRK